MTKVNVTYEPHGSPHGKFKDPVLKECPECSGTCYTEGETCYCCDGTGSIEMTADEEQLAFESKMEEYEE